MSELLVEVRADAFPAITLGRAVARLKDDLVRELRQVGLGPRQAGTGFTGRRMLILLRGIPDSRRPGSAALGGGELSRVQAAAQAISRAVATLRWPGTARDAAAAVRWRRSVRGLLALLDDKVVPAAVFGVDAGRETIGHPTLSPAPFVVESAAQYRRELAARQIEIRFSERRKQVRELLLDAATQLGGELVDEAGLLDLVAAGCEVPGVVTGSLGSQHHSVPRELLVTALRERLRGFVLVREGRVLPTFLLVTDRPDDPERRIEQGCGWAASALLRDLAFFYARDRKLSVAELSRRLDDTTWEPRLGTYGARSERLMAFVENLCRELGWDEVSDQALEAARLLHADAATSLSARFPELRGVIGGLLTREDGYPDSVWQAIYDHARPAVGQSLMPRGRCATIVALAYWLDTLAGASLSGALTAEDGGRRRLLGSGGGARGELWAAARSVVRVVLNRGLPLDLRLVAAQSLRGYAAQGHRITSPARVLTGYLELAVRAVLRDDGHAIEDIEGVLRAAGSSLLPDVLTRLQALAELRRSAGGQETIGRLATTAQTLDDMLSDTEEHELDVRLLTEEAEKDLYVSLQNASRPSGGLAIRGGADWIERMAALDEAVHALLRDLLVHDEDQRVRVNRLALLQEVRRLFTDQVRWAELLRDGVAIARSTSHTLPSEEDRS